MKKEISDQFGEKIDSLQKTIQELFKENAIQAKDPEPILEDASGAPMTSIQQEPLSQPSPTNLRPTQIVKDLSSWDFSDHEEQDQK